VVELRNGLEGRKKKGKEGKKGKSRVRDRLKG